MNSSLFSSLTRRSTHLLRSLKRFTPFDGCHYRSYVRPSGYYHERQNGQRLLTENTSGSSSSISYAIPAAFLGAVGGLVFYLHNNDEKRAIPKGHGKVQEGVASTGPSVGGPFTLINTDHQMFTEQDLRGKWVLLYFGYTSSPDAGPAEVEKLAKITDILGSISSPHFSVYYDLCIILLAMALLLVSCIQQESKQKVKVLPVFVTLDPQRDSTSHLKAYLREFDSRVIGLTGPIAAIKQMAQQYRVYFRKVEEDGDDYLVESSHNMYLINPNMEIVRNFGLRSSEKEMIDDILTELNKSAGGWSIKINGDR